MYNLAEDNYEQQHGDCKPGEKYAIIIHGWTESCETAWVTDLVQSKVEKTKTFLRLNRIIKASNLFQI